MTFFSPVAAFGAAGFLVAVAIALMMWRRARQSERQLAAQLPVMRRNQAIVDGSGEGILELDDTGKVVFANVTALRLLGYESDRELQFDYRRLVGASDYIGPRDATRIGYTTDMLRGIGAVLRCKDGRMLPVEYRMLPLRRSDGDAHASGLNRSARAASPPSSLLVFRDLTERARIDVMLADMQHMAKVGAWEVGVGSARLSVSEGITRRLQLPPGRSLRAKDLLRRITRKSRGELYRAARYALQLGREFDLELQVNAQTGVMHGGEWLRVIGKAERIESVTLRLYGTVQDITDQRQAEFRVQETSEFFGATIDALPSSVMFFDASERLVYCNASPLSRWLGLQVVEGGCSLGEALGENALQLEQEIRRALQGEAAQWLRPFIRAEEKRQIQCNFVPRPEGQLDHAGCWVVLTDVTELKLLEARLHQAEKMQAVGQLTGGVAHDFNNLLGVVLGNLQLLERDLPSDEGVQRKLTTALRAALRGSELTRRLLSFARREPLDAQVIDVNAQLLGLSDLLKQTLGDPLQVRFDLDPACWMIKVDVGQLENAVLNLALNARDAMSPGGQLTVKTRNVRPTSAFFREQTDMAVGDYVELSIVDNGRGIPPQLLNRIFEPFFTTKEIGKGSGLGLAMVHGFVKQSHGAIVVASEPGMGANFSLYLPRSLESRPAVDDAPDKMPKQGRGETILVVEDDTDLRATTVLALQDQGYTVIEASSAEVAWALLERPGKVDALFADIVLPGGMFGTELAQRAQSIRPQIRILLTSGYQGELASKTGASVGVYLAKPYRSEELAAKIRALLDSRPDMY